MLSFSGITFVLFCFVFVFLLFVEAAAVRSIGLRSSIPCAPTATRIYLTTICVLFSSFFIHLEISLFPSTSVLLPLSLCIESTWYVFPSQMVFFYILTTGWIFYIILCKNSIKTVSCNLHYMFTVVVCLMIAPLSTDVYHCTVARYRSRGGTAGRVWLLFEVIRK